METNEMFNIESREFAHVYEYGPFSFSPILQLKYPPNNPWVNFIFPDEIGIERSTNTITNISSISSIDVGFVPATLLGKKLLALRKKAIAEGMKLLDEDEILEEVRRRRGEEEYADIY